MQMESVGRGRVNTPEYRGWTAGLSQQLQGHQAHVVTADESISERECLPLGALFIPLLIRSHTWIKGSESLSPCGEAATFLCNSLW